jgi:hypothetical protein
VAALLAVTVLVGTFEALAELPAGSAIAVTARFAATFLAGTVLFLFADRVPFDGRLAAAATVTVVAVSFLDRSHALLALPLAYVCLWAGARWRTDRCRRRSDQARARKRCEVGAIEADGANLQGGGGEQRNLISNAQSGRRTIAPRVLPFPPRGGRLPSAGRCGLDLHCQSGGPDARLPGLLARGRTGGRCRAALSSR